MGLWDLDHHSPSLKRMRYEPGLSALHEIQRELQTRKVRYSRSVPYVLRTETIARAG
jgi:hypothetical protein